MFMGLGFRVVGFRIQSLNVRVLGSTCGSIYLQLYGFYLLIRG